MISCANGSRCAGSPQCRADGWTGPALSMTAASPAAAAPVSSTRRGMPVARPLPY